MARPPRKRLITNNLSSELSHIRRVGISNDPLSSRIQGREMMDRARYGSMREDVSGAFDLLRDGPSEGRDRLNGRGFQVMNRKMLATQNPQAVQNIQDMAKRRTASNMSDSILAFPKMRDPFEQWRERSWWWLKEGDFNDSLRRVRQWCTPSDSLVWMADGTFKPIGEIQVGEEVMGWEWRQPNGKDWRKFFVPTKVVATNRREAPMILRITTQSGREVRCTPEHKWANYFHSPSMWPNRAGRTLEYRTPSVGMTLAHHIDPTVPSVKIEKAWEFLRTKRTTGTKDRIELIEKEGPGEVISMQTETGNYVSQGFGSSNCRLLYMTHPLVPSLIDIYSRLPLLDMQFKHRDQRLASWYEQLFVDELHYDSFLYQLSREVWTVGEAFPLGSWHDGLGVWDADELINPDDVIVSRNPALRQYQFHLRVPEGIKKLIETRQPREEYEMLLQMYPYVLEWAMKDKEIPVSDVLMKHIKFDVNPWEPHGVPILLRAFKVLDLELSLDAAQKAVSDRLYSPLLLATLGFDDVGDGDGPWIPEPEDLDSLRDDLALTLMSDFRLMVFHHGLNIESVFGREMMPRYDTDFDRVDMQLMRVFGIAPELLQGGTSGVPYATGAISRELLIQMLTTHQKKISQFLHDRMAVVAERQGHYEYEKRGTMRIPVYETVLVQDDETGEEYLEERPKLAVPEVIFKALSVNDENLERQFLMEMKSMGVPISDDALMVNIPFEFSDELERTGTEKLQKTLAELEYQKKLFDAIFMNQLPVPPDLAPAYSMYIAGMQGMTTGMPIGDITAPASAPNIAPNMMGLAPGLAMGGPEEMGEGGPQARPEESDEMRGGMPKQKKSSGLDEETQARVELIRQANKVREERLAKELEEIEMQSLPAEEANVRRLAAIERGYEWVAAGAGLDPSTFSVRISNEFEMPSPSHMKVRRKMAVPKGTVIQIAADHEVDLTPQQPELPEGQAENE